MLPNKVLKHLFPDCRYFLVTLFSIKVLWIWKAVRKTFCTVFGIHIHCTIFLVSLICLLFSIFRAEDDAWLAAELQQRIDEEVSLRKSLNFKFSVCLFQKYVGNSDFILQLLLDSWWTRIFGETVLLIFDIGIYVLKGCVFWVKISTVSTYYYLTMPTTYVKSSLKEYECLIPWYLLHGFSFIFYKPGAPKTYNKFTEVIWKTCDLIFS